MAQNTKKSDSLAKRYAHFWDVYSYTVRQDIIEKNHAEALVIDAEFNQSHQDDFSNSTPMMQAVWVNLNHAEALEIDSAQYADHYTYVKPHATSLVFKTDGRRVWWWSFNREVWFPDFNVNPQCVHNHVSSGNAHTAKIQRHKGQILPHFAWGQ